MLERIAKVTSAISVRTIGPGSGSGRINKTAAAANVASNGNKSSVPTGVWNPISGTRADTATDTITNQLNDVGRCVINLNLAPGAHGK